MKGVVDIDMTTPHYPSLSTRLNVQSRGARKGQRWSHQSGEERDIAMEIEEIEEGGKRYCNVMRKSGVEEGY